MAQQDIPFSMVLSVLEKEGYRLQRTFGAFRYFEPPARLGPKARRIGFPVKDKLVEYKHVQAILETIDEDKERQA